MKKTYYFSVYDMTPRDIGGDDIQPGDLVLVYTRENAMTGGVEWHINKAFAASGYPGNMDGSVRRFHGWRGTTNDQRIEAHGVFRVKSVSTVYRDLDGNSAPFLKVVLTGRDVKADAE